MVTLRINGQRVDIEERTLWGIALPVAAVIAGTAIVGPLVLAAAGGALAVGALFATTASFALSAALIPLLFLVFSSAFAFASVGVFLLPVALTAAIAAGGLFLSFGSAKGLASLYEKRQRRDKGRGRGRRGGAVDEDEQDEDEAARAAAREAEAAAQRELRMFDEQLRRRERERERG